MADNCDEPDQKRARKDEQVSFVFIFKSFLFFHIYFIIKKNLKEASAYRTLELINGEKIQIEFFFNKEQLLVFFWIIV